MEYLDGETLAERLKKGALPLDRALRFALDIADALDKAHRQGVVHRDLKPGNIMLTVSGPKLLDFGLAKLTPGATASSKSFLETKRSVDALTTQGTILGTLQYMPPEQLEGQDADARADIFAFGAVLYEMLTGRAAFEGKSQVTLISAIVSSEPTAASTIRPEVPPQLDHIMKRCLAKNIFYLGSDEKLMAVAVSGDVKLNVSSPQPLFETSTGILSTINRTWQQPYDVSTDGKRFLVLTGVQSTAPPPVTVFVNWQTNVKR